MTTYVDFQPSQTTPFQFQATLDGEHYVVTVPWNIMGERYYVSVSDLNNNVIVYRSVASSTAVSQAALSWANGTATASLSSPHNVPLGSVARITVANTGSAYDGTYLALAVDATDFTYPLPSNPGPASGGVSQDVNLVGGYFTTSSLVFRDNTQQFEVSP